MPKWSRRRIANPLLVGSSPTAGSKIHGEKMSHSVNSSDSRSSLVQFPFDSDDCETVKQQAVPTPTVPVPVVKATGSSVAAKKVSK